ncbi:MAG TPA: hypothetical protein VK453_25275 [Micromonosporaceae bacterium]|nr:hypothetical protein [Micromonosporaceae bacterium]
MPDQSVPLPLWTTEPSEDAHGSALGVATAIPAPLPHRHAACGERWSGSRTCHCGSCHITTTGVSTFDAHRPKGYCLAPSAVGLTLIPGRASDVWGTTSAEDGDE